MPFMDNAIPECIASSCLFKINTLFNKSNVENILVKKLVYCYGLPYLKKSIIVFLNHTVNCVILYTL